VADSGRQFQSESAYCGEGPAASRASTTICPPLDPCGHIAAPARSPGPPHAARCTPSTTASGRMGAVLLSLVVPPGGRASPPPDLRPLGRQGQDWSEPQGKVGATAPAGMSHAHRQHPPGRPVLEQPRRLLDKPPALRRHVAPFLAHVGMQLEELVSS